MLSQNERLRSFEVSQVKKQGDRGYTPNFSFSRLQNRPSYFRCSVVVPKKIYKKSHQRNSIRRLVYQTIKENYPQFPPNVWVVVFVKKKIDHLSKSDVLEELLAYLDK